MKGSYEDRSPWDHVAFGTIAHFKTDARSPSQLRGLNLILIDGLAHALSLKIQINNKAPQTAADALAAVCIRCRQ